MKLDLEDLLEILEGDREVLDTLMREGIVEPDDARVARVLVRDLEVNWPGVEIILRMRREIYELHQQTEELLKLVASRMRDTPGSVK